MLGSMPIKYFKENDNILPYKTSALKIATLLQTKFNPTSTFAPSINKERFEANHRTFIKCVIPRAFEEESTDMQELLRHGEGYFNRIRVAIALHPPSL